MDHENNSPQSLHEDNTLQALQSLDDDDITKLKLIYTELMIAQHDTNEFELPVLASYLSHKLENGVHPIKHKVVIEALRELALGQVSIPDLKQRLYQESTQRTIKDNLLALDDYSDDRYKEYINAKEDTPNLSALTNMND